jgi:excisionase family DNA binding protein
LLSRNSVGGLVPTKPVTWNPSAHAALDRLKDKLFATTTETAAVLRYDHRTVRKAIEAGEIPAVKYGATWRVPTAWLREQASLGTGRTA